MPRKSNSRPNRRSLKRERALARRLRIAERQAQEHRDVGPLLSPSQKLGYLPLRFVLDVQVEVDDLERQGLDLRWWV